MIQLMCLAFRVEKATVYCYNYKNGPQLFESPDDNLTSSSMSEKHLYFLFNGFDHWDVLQLCSEDTTSASGATGVGGIFGFAKRRAKDISKGTTGQITDPSSISGSSVEKSITLINAVTINKTCLVETSKNSNPRKPESNDIDGAFRPIGNKFSSAVWNYYLVHRSFDASVVLSKQAYGEWALCKVCVEQMKSDLSIDPWINRPDSTTTCMSRHLKRCHSIEVTEHSATKTPYSFVCYLCFHWFMR